MNDRHREGKVVKSLHTVMIANDRMTRLFADYKRLFDPFLKDGQVSFCTWNEDGPDLDTALPDLGTCIGEEHIWRAVIVHDPGCWQDEDGTEIFDEYNPYDYAVNRNGAGVGDSPIPLIRLTHLLAGYPELGICELKEKPVGQRKNPEIAEYEAVEYAEEIRRQHKKLQEKYDLLRFKPRELWIVSLRRRPKKPTRKDLKNIWHSNLESESSLFWQRNNYPEICRFLCFDVTERQNGFYTKDLFEFWTTVLTLSVNKVPPSMLQAYRVYRVNCKIDQDSLRETLLHQYARLIQADSAVTAAMKVKTELTFAENEQLLEPQTVPLVFEPCGENGIQVTTRELGLARDCPQDEFEKWNEGFRGAKSTLAQYVKEPRRAINRAAEYTRETSENFFEDAYELDEIQREEIEEIALQLEEDILSSKTTRMANLEAFEGDMHRSDDEVYDVIRGRMTRKTTILAGLIAVAAYFCGFIPYLYQSRGESMSTFFASLKLTGIGIACFAATAFLLLFVFRRRLKKAIEKFNDLLSTIILSINQAANTFGEYLTLICTYRKAQSIIQGVGKKKASVISQRSLLRMHRTAVKDFQDQVSMWCAAYDIKIISRPIPAWEEYYDFEMMPDDCRIYYLDKNTGEPDIMINTSGELISAPYPFVSGLSLERVELYERKEEA